MPDSYHVICPDGVIRHAGALSYGGAKNYAEWGHVCMASYLHKVVRVSRTVEAGNIHVGDMIVLPGDLVATVETLDAMPLNDRLDAMAFTTEFGTTECRLSDPFTLIERPV
jgi:hypothetical protein